MATRTNTQDAPSDYTTDTILASDVVKSTKDGWSKAKPVVHLHLHKDGEIAAEIWRSGEAENPFTYEVPNAGFEGAAYIGSARNLKSAKEHIQVILSVLEHRK